MDTNPRDLDALLAHSGWARALARSLVRDPGRADDLVQRAWLAALRTPPGEGTPPRRWLATVLRNFARQDAREASRRQRRETAAARSESAGGSDAVDDSADIQIRLITAVRELPEPNRSAVWARYYEGLAPRDIAARDGVPIETVKRRIARGLESLRKRFDREHGGDRGAWLAAFAPLARPDSLASWAIGGALVGTKWKVWIAAVVVLCGLGVWTATSGVESAPPAELGVAPVVLSLDAPRGEAPRITGGSERAVRAPIAGQMDIAVATVAVPMRIVHGRVLDLQRNPVANLQIARFDRAEPFDIRSAADGTFELPLDDFGSALEARGPGWATVWADQHDSALPPRVVTILVARAGRMAGVVLDQEGGRPVPGAFVVARAGADALRALSDVVAPDYHEFEYSARSDELGRFDLGEVPLVRGSISAVRNKRKSEAVEIPLQPRDDLELRLDGAGGEDVVVRGRVLDASGAPADGATVALADVLTRSQSDGTFELKFYTGTLAADRRFDLVAVRGGALPARIAIGTRVELELAVGRSFELVLGGVPLAISGRVVDSDGKPVAGASVSIDDEEQLGRFPRDDAYARHWVRITSIESVLRERGESERLLGLPAGGTSVTDQNGSFRIEGLQDRSYGVRAQSNVEMARGRAPQVAAGTRDLRIELDTRSPTRRVRGHAVDTGGRPIADARVSVTISFSGDRDRLTIPSTSTGTDGAFEFEAVRGTVVQIAASTDWQESIVEPKPGDSLDDVTITLGWMCAIQVDMTANPGLATAFEVHDARLGPRHLYFTSSTAKKNGGYWVRGALPRRPIVEGRSDVVTVMEGELTAVLFRGEQEVARIPIVLAEQGLTIVRP